MALAATVWDVVTLDANEIVSRFSQNANTMQKVGRWSAEDWLSTRERSSHTGSRTKAEREAMGSGTAEFCLKALS